MEHPVFEIKHYADLFENKNLISPNLTFNRKILYRIALPNTQDYINEGNL